MRHPIPRDALDDRLGFIGTSGSGKTYNAGSAVEILLSNKQRVVIIDPLGVWWGLRLNSDGKAKGFDIAIFGGPHGDLPLTENAGALIGETAIGMTESCIIDLSELKSRAAERRFMVAFLETIYRKATGDPFHLIVDEADLFAPQRPQAGDEVLLGHMENIVRRGRVKGFIPWIISQRPAVVNKNVLSQVDGLLAFKLTSVQDRDALDSWIEGQADKAQGKEIKASLPTLQIGQGIVWLPGHQILRTADFPKKATFDSSRRLKRGEKSKARSLKPLNLAALKERLAAVEKEAKADNPKALRADIAKLQADKAALERQIAAAQSAAPKVDPDAIKKAEERGFEQAKKKLENASQRALIKAKREALTTIAMGLTRYANEIGQSLKNLEGLDALLAIEFTPTPQASVSRVTPTPRPAPAAPATSRNGPIFKGNMGALLQPAGAGTFTGPQLRVLRSLAMWKALGHDAPSREMVAAASGYSPSSGGFNNLLGSLSTMGAIGKPMPGHISLLTDAKTMSRDDGRDMLLANLSNPQRKLVDALVGRGMRSREELGTDTGYSASSGGFNNLIGSLSTLGIIVKPQPGHVALSDWAEELLNNVARAA